MENNMDNYLETGVIQWHERGFFLGLAASAIDHSSPREGRAVSEHDGSFFWDPYNKARNSLGAYIGVRKCMETTTFRQDSRQPRNRSCWQSMDMGIGQDEAIDASPDARLL